MANSILMPPPPLLPDLTWRAISLSDLAAIVDLVEACERTDGGLSLLNEPASLQERYFPQEQGFGLGAFDLNDQLVACSSVFITRQSDLQRAVIVGQVRPDWRQRGLGSYLMDWSERQVQALFTSGPADKRLLRISTEALTGPARRLYEARGFKAIFEELVMQRELVQPLPESPIPAGLNVSTWDPALYDQFFQAYQAAFRERPGFPGYTATEWIDDLRENDRFKKEWSLLLHTNEIPLGFVTASAERPGGYVIQIGIVPNQRRRGLASALMLETMRRMQAEGLKAVQLAVNVNNPGAIQTYEALAFITVGRRARFEREAVQTWHGKAPGL